MSSRGLVGDQPIARSIFAMLVVIVTAHPQIDYADVASRGPAVLDFRGVLRSLPVAASARHSLTM